MKKDIVSVLYSYLPFHPIFRLKGLFKTFLSLILTGMTLIYRSSSINIKVVRKRTHVLFIRPTQHLWISMFSKVFSRLFAHTRNICYGSKCYLREKLKMFLKNFASAAQTRKNACVKEKHLLLIFLGLNIHLVLCWEKAK